MTPRMSPGMGLDPFVDASSRAISAELEEFPGAVGGRPVESVNAKTCLVCEREFRPRKPWQTFCSARCRRLAWAVKELVREYLAGKANGLRDAIERLRT